MIKDILIAWAYILLRLALFPFFIAIVFGAFWGLLTMMDVVGEAFTAHGYSFMWSLPVCIGGLAVLGSLGVAVWIVVRDKQGRL